MTQFKHSHLGSSVIWWLNYISSVGREYIFNESSLKFPVTDHLERFFRENIRVEFEHPLLKNRKIDLYYYDKENIIENAIEFKYVLEDSTRDAGERKRIFYDLMRMYLFSDTKKRGYFLICGNETDFKTSFKNLNLKPTFPITQIQAGKPISLTIDFYSEWFSFDEKAKDRTIDLSKQEPLYKTVYDSFVTEYNDSYKAATNSDIIMPASIKTRLLYLSDDSSGNNIPQTMKIGIWEVLK